MIFCFRDPDVHPVFAVLCQRPVFSVILPDSQLQFAALNCSRSVERRLHSGDLEVLKSFQMQPDFDFSRPFLASSANDGLTNSDWAVD